MNYLCPLSEREFRRRFSADFGIFSLHLVGASSIAASLNFIATSMKIRTKGIDLFYVHLFVWAAVVTAVMLVMSLPVFHFTSWFGCFRDL